MTAFVVNQITETNVTVQDISSIVVNSQPITNTLIVDDNIATIVNNETVTAVVVPTTSSVIVTSQTLIPVNSTLGNINLTGKQDGSLLIYNANSDEWVAQTTLNKQIIDSGQF